jgi:hypothetical protein
VGYDVDCYDEDYVWGYDEDYVWGYDVDCYDEDFGV